MSFGFGESGDVEREAWERFQFGFLQRRAKDGIVTRYTTEREQKSKGDAFYVCATEGNVVNVECKAERGFTGNLCFEFFSSRFDMQPGWIFGLLDCHRINYVFLNAAMMFTMSRLGLQNWCFGMKPGEGRIYWYPEKTQNAHVQRNVPFNRIVPITALAASPGVDLRAFDMEDGGASKELDAYYAVRTAKERVGLKTTETEMQRRLF